MGRKYAAPGGGDLCGVRQIREKSIAKLRDSGNAKILMKYLG